MTHRPRSDRRPTPARGRSPRGPSRDSGVVLVEFALVLPIFAIMLFAMIQFGMVFAGWAQLRNSVQAAARAVAMGDTGGAGSNCSDITGAPGDDDVNAYTQDMVCQVQEQVGSPVGTTGTPEVGLYVPGDGTVKVCVQVAAQAFTGFFGAIQLSADSQLYLEALGPQGRGDGNHNVLQNYNPYQLAGCQGG